MKLYEKIVLAENLISKFCFKALIPIGWRKNELIAAVITFFIFFPTLLLCLLNGNAVPIINSRKIRFALNNEWVATSPRAKVGKFPKQVRKSSARNENYIENIKTSCNECKQHLNENFDYLCCHIKWCLKHDHKLLFGTEARKMAFELFLKILHDGMCFNLWSGLFHFQR